MWELRFVAVSDDGAHVVVSSPDLDDEAFTLPITDELRDAVAPPVVQAPRPAPTFGEPLTPREIQSRVRTGESPESISLASGVPVERIDRFAGPVLREREHIAHAAGNVRVSGQVRDASATLAELVETRLGEQHVDPESVAWDSWRRDDGVWTVQISYDLGGDRHTAEFSWDPPRGQLRPYGAAARALISPPEPQPAPAPEPPPAPGLRMVPPRGNRQERPAPVEEPTPEGAAEQPAAIELPLDAPAATEQPRPLPSRGDVADGVTKRAVVPRWDDIIFGVRRDS